MVNQIVDISTKKKSIFHPK
jgi:predicted acyltransferase (DUF342 family)